MSVGGWLFPNYGTEAPRLPHSILYARKRALPGQLQADIDAYLLYTAASEESTTESLHSEHRHARTGRWAARREDHRGTRLLRHQSVYKVQEASTHGGDEGANHAVRGSSV